MNIPQKQLAQQLMSGCYLMKRADFKGERFVLFTGNMKSICFVKDKHVKPFKPLFKKSKIGRLTLNLSEVRKQDGRTFIKKLYKIKQHEKGS